MQDRLIWLVFLEIFRRESAIHGPADGLLGMSSTAGTMSKQANALRDDTKTMLLPVMLISPVQKSQQLIRMLTFLACHEPSCFPLFPDSVLFRTFSSTQFKNREQSTILPCRLCAYSLWDQKRPRPVRELGGMERGDERSKLAGVKPRLRSTLGRLSTFSRDKDSEFHVISGT